MNLKMLCLPYLIIASVIDARKKRIPNMLSLAVASVILIAAAITEPSKIPLRLLNAVFFGSVFLAVRLLTGGLGAGDVKLVAVVASCLGFFMTAAVLVSASLTGVFVFTAARLAGKDVSILPFAPLVLAGYILSELLRTLLP